MPHIAGFLLILLCILFETAQQLTYRVGSRAIKYRQLILFAGTLLYLAELAAWLTVLRFLPLGIALPLMGANYATVALASQWMFAEKVTSRRWVGIACVIAGFSMIARYAP